MKFIESLDIIHNLGFLVSGYIFILPAIYKIKDNKYLKVELNNDISIINDIEKENLNSYTTRDLIREIYRVNYNTLYIMVEDFFNIKNQLKYYNNNSLYRLSDLDPKYTFEEEIKILNYILDNYNDKKHYDNKSLYNYLNNLDFISNRKKEWFKTTIFHL